MSEKKREDAMIAAGNANGTCVFMGKRLVHLVHDAFQGGDGRIVRTMRNAASPYMERLLLSPSVSDGNRTMVLKFIDHTKCRYASIVNAKLSFLTNGEHLIVGLIGMYLGGFPGGSPGAQGCPWGAPRVTPQGYPGATCGVPGGAHQGWVPRHVD